MTWTSGEIITASRLIDVPANKLIGGDVISSFNLLKIASSNIFTSVIGGTGSVTYDNSAGTITLSTPANNDTIEIHENSKIIPLGLPRIGIFKIKSLTMNGTSISLYIGFQDGPLASKTDYVLIKTDNGGTSWEFVTHDGISPQTTTISGGVSANDVYIIYLTDTRVSLFKNNAHVATHTVRVPNNAQGHYVVLYTQFGEGAGSTIVLDFMS